VEARAGSTLADAAQTLTGFPPMQDPATYNLEQVIKQVQQMRATSHTGD
jgi:arylsulfatase